jgi:hypothetical protein
MIPSLREAYNAQFSETKYATFLTELYGLYNHKPGFRIGETPVFIPDDFRDKLIKACDDIADAITRPDFKEITEGSMYRMKTNIRIFWSLILAFAPIKTAL